MPVVNLFGVTGQTTWQQDCARAALIFLYGLVVLRVAGRRIFAQWNALDIIVAIVTGSSLSRALTGNADLFGTLAATTLLMLMHCLLVHAAARWAWLSQLLEGTPVRLAPDGRVNDGQLVRHAVSPTTFYQALRSAGPETAADTRLMVLEPSGRISVIR